jgi:hypothetical protein
MPSKRIDELDARTVADTDLLPVTPSGGPSGKATVAAIVAEGLSQPNSASSGAGASLSIIAADGVTSGAGGSIILEPGAQATTGGNGTVIIRQANFSSSNNQFSLSHNGTSPIIDWTAGQSLFLGAETLISRGGGGAGGIATINLKRIIVATVAGSTKFKCFADTPSLLCSSDSALTFNSASDLGGSSTGDVGIIRSTIGVLRISNGSTGGGSLAYTSSTPAAIVANQNDYVLTGSAFQRLNCTTAADITGIAPPTGGAHVDGRMIRLVSVGTATVTLKHNDAASAAANRMYMSSGNHLALAVNEWADLVYDSTDNGSGAAGWRVVKYA